MQYVLLFLEGIITFISPCMLPMLPIYVIYFTGEGSEGRAYRALRNSIGFVLGFTLIFVLMGAFAGTIGGFLRQHSVVLNVITGLMVVLFGLSFLNVINLPFVGHSEKIHTRFDKLKFLSSVVFGIIFSISWTPCVGVFLGSALMQAGQQGNPVKGIIMLLFYSMGLGLPFVISAVLIDNLKSIFNSVKRHYKIINLVSGIFLILVGILMMTGTFGYFLSLLT